MSIIPQEGGEVSRVDDSGNPRDLSSEGKSEQERRNERSLEILLQEFPNAFDQPPITDSKGGKVYKVSMELEKTQPLVDKGLWPQEEFHQLVWKERGKDRDPVLMSLTSFDAAVYFSEKGIVGVHKSKVSAVENFLKEEGGPFENILGIRKDFLDSYPKEDQKLFFKEMAFQEKIAKKTKTLEEGRLSEEDFRAMAREAKQEV